MGHRYVYQPDVEHERTNLIDLQDAGGRPIGKMIVETAKEEAGRGWVHYRWNRPHETEPLWKSTCLVRAVTPSGKSYLLASGLYQAHVERAFVIDAVDSTAALLEKEDIRAIATLRDPKSRFFFHDTYVFVISATGLELVNRAFPALEGRTCGTSRTSREITRFGNVLPWLLARGRSGSAIIGAGRVGRKCRSKKSATSGG